MVFVNKEIRIITPKGDIYTVSGLNTLLTDPFCDCLGFQFRGYCKHIQQAIDRLDNENEGRDRN